MVRAMLRMAHHECDPLCCADSLVLCGTYGLDFFFWLCGTCGLEFYLADGMALC